mmetsp:Transcript_88216/g.156179  ORF Transcript_88216/g.156179 Transcript_88216/m.156179 type:complete len:207 (+) Transcript_88216:251-871(+)
MHVAAFCRDALSEAEGLLIISANADLEVESLVSDEQARFQASFFRNLCQHHLRPLVFRSPQHVTTTRCHHAGACLSGACLSIGRWLVCGRLFDSCGIRDSAIALAPLVWATYEELDSATTAQLEQVMDGGFVQGAEVALVVLILQDQGLAPVGTVRRSKAILHCSLDRCAAVSCAPALLGTGARQLNAEAAHVPSLHHLDHSQHHW